MTTYNAYVDAGINGNTTADPDADPVSLGTEFYVTQSGCTLTQIHWFQPSSGSPSSNVRQLSIWSVNADGTSGTRVAGPFNSTPSGSGWQTYTLATPLALTANQRYRVATYHPNSPGMPRYSATASYFATGAGSTNRVVGPLVIPSNANALGNRQGSYIYFNANGFPSNAFNGGSYWNDVTIDDGAGSTPTNTLTTELTGSGSLSTSVSPLRTLNPSGSSTGTLTAPVSPLRTLVVALTGEGTLSSVLSPLRTLAANFTGLGSFSSTIEKVEGEVPSNTITVSLTGEGTLTAPASPLRTLTHAGTGLGTLSATFAPTLSIDSTLAGEGSLSTIVTEVREGASGPVPSFVLLNNRLRLIF